MMYDELVKNLRELCEMTALCDDHSCFECPCEEECGSYKNGRLSAVYRQAADAIEELSRDLDSMNEANIALHGALPKWIPSEDYLPQNGEEIITLGPAGGMEIGFYRGLSGTRKDKWNWKKHTVRTVKFWLPRKELPEPPKEEK